jgi:AAA domain
MPDPEALRIARAATAASFPPAPLRVVSDRPEPPDYDHIPDGPEGPNLDPDLETQSMHDFPGDRPAPKSRGNPQDQAQEQPTQSAAELGIWDAGAKPLRPPPRGWLLGNQFCRGFLSSLDASGGTGKTAVRTLQMLSLTTMRELTGEHVFRRSRVLAVSFEDGKEEQERRVLAAMLHHNIKPEHIKGWLYCWTPKGIKLAHLDKEGSPACGKLEKMLRDVIAELQIDLVSLDPFIKLHALAENDNGAMDFVTDLLVQIAIDCKVGVDAPHHTKKGQQTAGDADAGRGAGAKRDAGRLGYTLTRMTADEAKLFGIPAEFCALYVRLDSSKVNIAPPSSGATWFKLVGVRLGNETADYPAGDNVQTVERWYPPETWTGVSSTQLNAALTDIEAGLENGQRYTEGNKTTPRSAWPMVQRHCPDRTEAQCREIIKTWVKNGVLVSDDYQDPIEHKTRKCLRVIDGKRPT